MRAWRDGQQQPRKRSDSLEGKVSGLGVWTGCLESKAGGKQVIPRTWTLRRKQSPAREVTKCKARIRLRGDLMADSLETCTPAAWWSAICPFVICSIHNGRATRSADSGADSSSSPPMAVAATCMLRASSGRHNHAHGSNDASSSEGTADQWKSLGLGTLARLATSHTPLAACQRVRLPRH